MADENENENENTTLPTTEATTTEATTQAPVDANIQTQEGAPSLTTSTTVAAANSPTLNDVEQTQAERLAQSRSLALANHAVDHPGSSAGEASDSEEVVA